MTLFIGMFIALITGMVLSPFVSFKAAYKVGEQAGYIKAMLKKIEDRGQMAGGREQKAEKQKGEGRT